MEEEEVEEEEVEEEVEEVVVGAPIATPRRSIRGQRRQWDYRFGIILGFLWDSSGRADGFFEHLFPDPFGTVPGLFQNSFRPFCHPCGIRLGSFG